MTGRLKISYAPVAINTAIYSSLIICIVSLSLWRSETSVREIVPLLTASIQYATEEIQQPESKDSVHCALWADNQDDWWQDHPDWRVSKENKTHLCFAPMKNPEQAEYYREMHRIQFGENQNCTDTFQRVLIGTGFAAAASQLTSGFFYAFAKKRKTFVRSKHWRPFTWLYNPVFNESIPPEQQPLGACESQDLFCYYLPVTNCDYEEGKSGKVPGWFLTQHTSAYKENRDPEVAEAYRHHISYMTRLNQKTRHGLYQLMDEIAPPSRKPSNQQSGQTQQWGDCVAFHVRRTDASSERQHPRNFYPLQSYIDGARQVTNLTAGDNIVLLTDDDSTIQEAKILHPEYNWLYIDRQRYFGAQTKNRHFPSGDPSLEFLNIYADLQMAAPCHTLIHGTSNMVTFIVHAMEEAMVQYYEKMCYDHSSTNVSLRTDVDCSNIPKLITRFRIDADQRNITYVSGKEFTEELRKKIQEAKAIRSDVSTQTTQ